MSITNVLQIFRKCQIFLPHPVEKRSQKSFKFLFFSFELKNVSLKFYRDMKKTVLIMASKVHNILQYTTIYICRALNVKFILQSISDILSCLKYCLTKYPRNRSE